MAVRELPGPAGLDWSWQHTKPVRYELRRQLHDRLADQRGEVRGALELTRDDAGLGWYETGTLHWAGVDRPVSRRLALRCRDGAWWMCFEDGRPFHRWLVGQPVRHDCGEDVYVGQYDLMAEGRIVVAWQVTGPHKDLAIRTEHRPTQRRG